MSVCEYVSLCVSLFDYVSVFECLYLRLSVCVYVFMFVYLNV